MALADDISAKVTEVLAVDAEVVANQLAIETLRTQQILLGMQHSSLMTELRGLTGPGDYYLSVGDMLYIISDAGIVSHSTTSPT